MKTTLHHFAYSITPDSLELFLKLLEKMGCSLDYREGDSRWCMIKQGSVKAFIQVTEVHDCPVVDSNKKINTHLAFLSDNPKDDVLEVKSWAKNNNIKFRSGSWSDKELWFDLPDIFLNFVVEIMDRSVVE